MGLRNNRSFVAVVVLVAVALAACSSSSHAASTSPSSAGPNTTTIPASARPAQPSAGCNATAVAKPGETRVDTTSGGTPRWYIRHLPPMYDGHTPLPVVLDLHGYEEGAVIHTKMSALGPYGDAHRFITITPQGSGTTVALWNTDVHSADMTFIGDLLDEIDRTLCADQRRIFVAGLSNGAMMTSAVACVYASRIAAAAPVAGIAETPGCTAKRAVPIVAFHGTADPFVSYTGGLGPKALALPAPNGKGTLGQSGIARTATGQSPSIPAVTAAWAKRNGCTASPPAAKTIAIDVTLFAWPCPPGAEVELYRITGGGHSWPGSVFSKAIAGVVGRTTFSISANDIMWRFFTAHSLP